MVLINRREVPGRRHFDLAHELFHILTWKEMPPEHVEDVEPKTRSRVEQLETQTGLQRRRKEQQIDYAALCKSLHAPPHAVSKAARIRREVQGPRWVKDDLEHLLPMKRVWREHRCRQAAIHPIGG